MTRSRVGALLGMFCGFAAAAAFALTRATPPGSTERTLWFLGAALIVGRRLTMRMGGSFEGDRSARLRDSLDRIGEIAIFVGAGFACGGRFSEGIDIGLAAALLALLDAYLSLYIVGIAILNNRGMMLLIVGALAQALLPAPYQFELVWEGHGSPFGFVSVMMALVIAGFALSSALRLVRLMTRPAPDPLNSSTSPIRSATP